MGIPNEIKKTQVGNKNNVFKYPYICNALILCLVVAGHASTTYLLFRFTKNK
jgi:hypothetical protein